MNIHVSTCYVINGFFREVWSIPIFVYLPIFIEWEENLLVTWIDFKCNAFNIIFFEGNSCSFTSHRTANLNYDIMLGNDEDSFEFEIWYVNINCKRIVSINRLISIYGFQWPAALIICSFHYLFLLTFTHNWKWKMFPLPNVSKCLLNLILTSKQYTTHTHYTVHTNE